MTAPERLVFRRELPGDCTDQQVIDGLAEIEQQLRDAGTPSNLVRTAMGYNADWSLYLVGWAALDANDWQRPT